MTKKTTVKLPAVGYVRVSTAEQAESGLSLEAQETRVRAMAEAQGLHLAELISDPGESAKTLDRPGMQQLLGLVNGKKIAAVVIYRLDRLTRNVKDFASLLELFEKKNVSLISVSESLDTGSAAGRMIINIMMVIAQWEREAIAERTSMALRHKRSKLEAYGQIPYGYVREGNRLVRDAAETAVVEEIRRRHKAGQSLRTIASSLNERQLSPKKNGKWHASTIRSVLQTQLHIEGEQSK